MATDPRTQPVSFNLTKAELSELKKAAEEARQSIAAYVRWAVLDCLDARDT